MKKKDNDKREEQNMFGNVQSQIYLGSRSKLGMGILLRQEAIVVQALYRIRDVLSPDGTFPSWNSLANRRVIRAEVGFPP